MIDPNTAASPPPVGELLSTARPTLQRVLWRFRIPPEDAEDLIQDAVVHYLRKWTEVREPRKWLVGALRNECLLYWRKRSRRRDDAIDQGILELVADTRELQEQAVLKRRLRELIGELEPRCQALLMLRYQLGYNDGEIADRTGYQKSSIDKIARRCVAALSRKLLSPRITGRF